MSEKKINYCKDIEESANKYEEYILNHRENVIRAYGMAEEAFKDLFPNVYNNYCKYYRLMVNLQSHDSSKFDDEEFDAYRNRFFPVEGTNIESKDIKDDFELAWLHHAHSNPHHPAYWTLVENGEIKYFNMPDIYIIEMLCDWMAMSKYYGSTTKEYWDSPSARKLPMTLNTKLKVTSFMGWMYNHNVHTLW